MPAPLPVPPPTTFHDRDSMLKKSGVPGMLRHPANAVITGRDIVKRVLFGKPQSQVKK